MNGWIDRYRSLCFSLILQLSGAASSTSATSNEQWLLLSINNYLCCYHCWGGRAVHFSNQKVIRYNLSLHKQDCTEIIELEWTLCNHILSFWNVFYKSRCRQRQRWHSSLSVMSLYCQIKVEPVLRTQRHIFGQTHWHSASTHLLKWCRKQARRHIEDFIIKQLLENTGLHRLWLENNSTTTSIWHQKKTWTV